MTAQNLLIANWKMWGTPQNWRDLAVELKGVDFACAVAIAPPQAGLSIVSEELAESSIHIASQNISRYKDNGHTGETSVAMAKGFGCVYGLVGHSERRLFESESDAHIAQKINLLQKEGVTPVLCIGETVDQKTSGDTLKILDDQLTSALKDATSEIVVAYEPVWAISNLAGENAPKLQLSDIEEAAEFIQTRLKELFPDAVNGIKILYGGSVNSSNASQLIDIKNIDGFLVGSASLKSHIFVEIASQIS